MNFFTTLTNVLIMGALAIPGYILKKCGFIKSEAVKSFTSLLLYVNLPFLLAKSFLVSGYDGALAYNMVVTLILSVIILIASFLFSFAIYRKFKDENAKKVSIFACMFSNFGFIGIPIMTAMFPDNPEMVMYCSVFNIAANILTWTLGVYIMSGDRKSMSIKKAILNPPVIALAAALPFFFLRVKLPEPIIMGVTFLGDMTTPLAMIIMGIKLAEFPIKELFNNLHVYIVSALRLVVIPLLSLGIMLLIDLVYPLDRMVIICMYIIAALPVAVSTILFAEKYETDSLLATKQTLLTTLLCVVTVPVLLLLVNFI